MVGALWPIDCKRAESVLYPSVSRSTLLMSGWCAGRYLLAGRVARFSAKKATLSVAFFHLCGRIL